MRVVDKNLLESYRGVKCTLCPARESTVAHHIKSVGSGGHDLDYNLLALCWKHHLEVHNIGLTRFVERHPMLYNVLTNKGWCQRELDKRWFYPMEAS